jgi:Flp pilus assembly pilin Flp
MGLNNKAQALVEYVLIIALISVLAISLVTFLGGYLKDSITKSSCALVGEDYHKGAKAGEGYCVEKDQ